MCIGESEDESDASESEEKSSSESETEKSSDESSGISSEEEKVTLIFTEHKRFDSVLTIVCWSTRKPCNICENTLFNQKSIVT